MGGYFHGVGAVWARSQGFLVLVVAVASTVDWLAGGIGLTVAAVAGSCAAVLSAGGIVAWARRVPSRFCERSLYAFACVGALAFGLQALHDAAHLAGIAPVLVGKGSAFLAMGPLAWCLACGAYQEIVS